MNVVFINQYSFTYLGGVELHILNLGRELQKQGAKVTLVCRMHQESGGWRPSAEGFRVIHAPSIRNLFAFLRRERLNIDVCHAHMSRKPYALCGILFARFLGIPTVFTPHCFYPSEELGTRLAKRVYDETFGRLTFWFSSRVINLTPKDQQDSLGQGMNVAKSRIIPNSICISPLQSTRSLSVREKYAIHREFLLHVGRFSKEKCIPFLVSNHASFSSLDLVMIGQDDGELKSVERLIRELNISNRVHIIQKIPFDELCSFYREARVLVMASRKEGLPTVILEAAVFGTPTIAPSVGGIPYLIQDEKVGRLYEWGDAEGYVRRVQQLIDGNTRIDEVTKKEFLSRFSWETNARKVAAVYQEVVHA